MSFEEKTPEMQAFLEEFFGTGTAIKTKICVFCGNEATTFRDEISEKEFGISGICQDCQDKVFESWPEDTIGSSSELGLYCP